MKFGVVPLAKAEGATLAHGILVGTERFSKGRILNADDIVALRNADISKVTVARLGKNDVPENEAAARIGAKLVAGNISARSASTGRVNLHADQPGLLQVKSNKINKINSIDPSVTVATLADFAVCQTGAMVATVKIIPFGAPVSAVEKAESAASGSLVLHPFQALNVGIIQTVLPQTKDTVLEKTVEVTRFRISNLGGLVNAAAHCNHEVVALAETLHAMLHLDMLVVFGASAVCDVEDVIPAAIRHIGGNVKRVGMPVDPGNLLVLGNKGKTIVIGAPGCARSPKENGFDWVLARLFAGLKISSRDIIKMGVGGLLMEIPSRPSPRIASQETVDD